MGVITCENLSNASIPPLTLAMSPCPILAEHRFRRTRMRRLDKTARSRSLDANLKLLDGTPKADASSDTLGDADTHPDDTALYHVEQVDWFEPWFAENIVRPIAVHIPRKVTPNQITLSNILIRAALLNIAWQNSQRPSPFSVNEFFVRSIVVAFLLFLTEVVDGLDGAHARMSNQCSKLGEVLDHIVDAMGIPLMSACVVFNTQCDTIGLGLNTGMITIMFNAQLVLYARCQKMVMPELSGPKAVMLTIIVVFVSATLICTRGRTDMITTIVITIVNVGGVLGVMQNEVFYIQRLFAWRHPNKDQNDPEEAEAIRASLLSLVPFAMVVAGFTIVFVLLHQPTLHTFVYGTDLVNVVVDSEDPRWFSPLGYVVLIMGVSIRVNGGMVLNTVLRRKHSNFDWSMLVWLVVIVAVHVAVVQGSSNMRTLAPYIPWVASAHLTALMIHHLYSMLYELKPAVSEEADTDTALVSDIP